MDEGRRESCRNRPDLAGPAGRAISSIVFDAPGLNRTLTPPSKPSSHPVALQRQKAHNFRLYGAALSGRQAPEPDLAEPGACLSTPAIRGTMKTAIHPQYSEIQVTCSCGNTFTTRSTDQQAAARRGLLGLPSVLYRQAEDRGHGRPRREIPPALRREAARPSAKPLRAGSQDHAQSAAKGAQPRPESRPSPRKR